MTHQNGLTDDIGRMLKLGGHYFTHYGIECQLGRIATAQAARGYSTDNVERMLEAQGQCNQARHDLLEIIPALVVRLQDAGHDVRDLLRFQHRIDGGGGPEAAGKGWEDLKVELQRVALRSPTKRRSPPRFPIMNADLARAVGQGTGYVSRQRERMGSELERERMGSGNGWGQS